MSSSYENVVGGKLKLKGKALDISGKKKKKRRQEYVPTETKEQQEEEQNEQGGDERRLRRRSEDEDEERERAAEVEDHRTPAEKRYEEQKTILEMKRLAKTANKSHRQKVEEFNQYLANLSEHYDIPKVGPG